MNNKIEKGDWGIRKDLIESRNRNLEVLESIFSGIVLSHPVHFLHLFSVFVDADVIDLCKTVLC